VLKFPTKSIEVLVFPGGTATVCDTAGYEAALQGFRIFEAKYWSDFQGPKYQTYNQRWPRSLETSVPEYPVRRHHIPQEFENRSEHHTISGNFSSMRVEQVAYIVFLQAFVLNTCKGEPFIWLPIRINMFLVTVSSLSHGKWQKQR